MTSPTLTRRRPRPAFTVATLATAGLIGGLLAAPAGAAAAASTGASVAASAAAAASSSASTGRAASAVSALASSSSRTLPSVIPSWATGQPALAGGGTAPVHLLVELTNRHPAELAKLARDVSMPTSASYRHFISAATYRQRYAPTPAAAAAVRQWLRSAGLTAIRTTASRSVIAAEAGPTVVGRALHVGFGRFRVGGTLLRAPLAEPQIPAALRGVVAGISGLAQIPMHSTASPAPGFVIGHPCSHYYGQKIARTQPSYAGKHQPYAPCGYTPKQLRAAYGVNATHLSGKGVTVAIVDAYASPTVEQDLNTYSKRHGLPRVTSKTFSQKLFPGATLIPEDPSGLGVVDPQGWAGEETLDVEAVHAMAPRAKIQYVAAAAPEDATLFFALAQIIDSDSAQVISNSYGSTGDADPADKTVFDTLTSQAAAKGITIDFSSGDDGDEVAAEGVRTADFPATSTGVTAVGGTTLEIDKRGHYAGETYWGTVRVPRTKHGWNFKQAEPYGSGGGGVSTSYSEPAWQKPVVPQRLATYGGVPAGRVVPDVSMDADSTTGFLMGQTQTYHGGRTHYGEYRIGGTSLSCPLFSGLVALAVQRHGGKGLGLITPTLYRAARKASGRVRVFHDPSAVRTRHGLSLLANVRPDHTDTTNPKSPETSTLRSLGNLGTLHALKGYDDSTGLGTPKSAALIKLLK